MIDECGADGMRIGGGNRSTWRKSTQGHFSHHKNHVTGRGIEPGPPWWEAGISLLDFIILVMMNTILWNVPPRSLVDVY
jgi:hypothetical protein